MLLLVFIQAGSTLAVLLQESSMAKNDNDDEDLDRPSRGKKLILILAIFLLLILLLGGGYFAAAWFFHLPPFEVKGPTPEELAAMRAAQDAVEIEQNKDTYVSFPQSFTFNVTADSGRHHTAQVGVVLVVEGPNNEALAKQHIELLSSTVLTMLSNQSYDSLLMPSGRARLKIQLLDALREKMSEVAKTPVVEQILFTAFVMQ